MSELSIVALIVGVLAPTVAALGYWLANRTTNKRIRLEAQAQLSARFIDLFRVIHSREDRGSTTVGLSETIASVYLLGALAEEETLLRSPAIEGLRHCLTWVSSDSDLRVAILEVLASLGYGKDINS